MKPGTTVCVHGTPTDKPCVLCNANSGVRQDEVVEVTTIAKSTCLKCKGSLAKLKCEVIDHDERFATSFAKCPCGTVYVFAVDAKANLIRSFLLQEILDELK